MTFYRTDGVVNVREYREALEMSVADLAKASGLALSTVQRADANDGTDPTKESTVRALAEALGVSKYQITCGPEELEVLREVEDADWRTEREIERRGRRP